MGEGGTGRTVMSFTGYSVQVYIWIEFMGGFLASGATVYTIIHIPWYTFTTVYCILYKCIYGMNSWVDSRHPELLFYSIP